MAKYVVLSGYMVDMVVIGGNRANPPYGNEFPRKQGKYQGICNFSCFRPFSFHLIVHFQNLEINSLITRNREYQGINREFFSSGYETSALIRGTILSRNDPSRPSMGTDFILLILAETCGYLMAASCARQLLARIAFQPIRLRTVPGLYSSKIATARVQPAEAPRILCGKQAMMKPSAGSASRLCSFSMWQ